MKKQRHAIAKLHTRDSILGSQNDALPMSSSRTFHHNGNGLPVIFNTVATGHMWQLGPRDVMNVPEEQNSLYYLILINFN